MATQEAGWVWQCNIPTYEKMWEIVRIHPGIKCSELATAVGCSKSTAWRRLPKLEMSNLLLYEDCGRLFAYEQGEYMISSSRILYHAAGFPEMPGNLEGACCICGMHGVGREFAEWDRPGFTGRDFLSDGTIICHACQFSFGEQSESLTMVVEKWWSTDAEAIAANPDRVAKWQKKHKTTALPMSEDINVTQKWNGWCIPQKMRNYTHIVKDGMWYPLNKGQKGEMKLLLLGDAGRLPELAVISETGQKHLVFRAKTNPLGQEAGWILFEEQLLWISQSHLAMSVAVIEKLLRLGFSKTEIETGDYAQHRIAPVFAAWWEQEAKAVCLRGTESWELSIFLSQRE